MGKTITLYAAQERKWIARIVFTGILVFLLYAFFTNTLLHQLERPVIRYPYVDLTYWLLHGLGIPEFITGNDVVAWIFDLLLIGTCIGCLAIPGSRVLVWAFIVLNFIYFITYNSFGTHHTSDKIGILLIAVPFAVRDLVSFSYLWQGLRYFLLFAFSNAFLWKLCRLSWLQPDQGVLIMKKNLAAYLYYHPGSVPADLYHWLLTHPALINGLFVVGLLMEGIFIAGFFTRKLDGLLLLFFVLLVFGFWLMADANFVPLLILGFTLVNFKRPLMLGEDFRH